MAKSRWSDNPAISEKLQTGSASLECCWRARLELYRKDAADRGSGDQFDAVMNYIFSRACLGFFGGERLDTAQRPGGYTLRPLSAIQFAGAVDGMLALYDWEVTLAQLNLLDSHDQPRFLTLVQGDKDALKLATLFQMTFPGAPCIYYGDEIGMEGRHDPDCRRAFAWDDVAFRFHSRLFLKAQSLSSPLQEGIRFFRHPLPASPSASPSASLRAGSCGSFSLVRPAFLICASSA